MKNLYTFIIALFFVNGAMAQWYWQNPIPQGNSLQSVFFPSPNIGYAVGWDGTIIKTNDSGTNWTVLSSGNKNDFNSVFFIDPNTGYAVGGSGTILKTTNGGTSWTGMSSGSTNDLSAVFFTNANTGYTVGINGTILATNDGGGPLGVNEDNPISNSLKLYPDPTCKELTVETVETGSLSVYNLNGVLLLQREITKPDPTINVSNLPDGMYVLKVVGEKEAVVGKFIKQ